MKRELEFPVGGKKRFVVPPSLPRDDKRQAHQQRRHHLGA